MDVPLVWVDPETRQVYIATPKDRLRELKDGVLLTESPSFDVPLAELFS